MILLYIMTLTERCQGPISCIPFNLRLLRPVTWFGHGCGVEDIRATGCPSCGKTETAVVAADRVGGLRTATAPDGFLARIMTDNSVRIVCSACQVLARSAQPLI